MRSKPFSFALSILVAVLAGPSSAETASPPELSYYLPEAAAYDPDVPEPASVLGWEVGAWHVRHDQLVAYMRLLAERSDRVRIEVTGKTHEERPLLLATISSPANLARIDEIRAAHLALADPSAAKPDTSSMPVVVYLGYSIHGNEASGSNAALLVAYHLAAARGGEVEEWLDDAVVLLDPSLNPDGLSRFAQWANMHRGRVLVADPNHREHDEGWPSGRTNHYWFDLNRDWLPLVHPESRARLASFHRWKPNVLIDAHEMGTDSTFFFQPGIPVRQNPLTPAKNLELTRKIARYHAEALDAIGSLYFTEEVFDDFYYGKGSSYPDVNGTVGILFEQGSARGHVQESDNGDLTLPFAIRNHLTASLSTLRASLAHRRELLDYQADFYRGALETARGDALRAYVFGDPHDPVRTRLFRELLDRHRIVVHALARPVESGGTRFEPGRAFVVPLAQAQYFLIRALFEKRVSFADSTFYDVSTWTLPLAYDLPYAELDRGAFSEDLVGEAVEPSAAPAGRFERPDGPVVAYAFPWSSYFAPRTLHRLLEAEVRCRAATRPFRAVTPEGERDFGYGTIVVPLGIQETDRDAVEAILEEGARRDGIEVFAVSTGLTPEGVDIGSPSLRPLDLPEVALLAGGGSSAYEVGEMWHLVDQRFEMPITLIDRERFGRADLDEYTHLVLVDGDYGDLPEDAARRLRGWIRGGGVLLATKRAARWADRLGREEDGSDDGSERGPQGSRDRAAEDDETDREDESERLPYAEARQRREAEMIGGAIFEVELDVTHPLAYGYERPELAVFRDSTIVLEPEENPYVTVAQYSDSPLVSGYVSGDNLAKIAGSPAVVGERMGRGIVVRMVDDPAFRGFWHGTDRLVMNALFFAPIVDRTPEP